MKWKIVRCTNCNFHKKSRYSFDICPKCNSSMMGLGIKGLTKEGHIIDLRKIIRGKIL
jgi:ribosomal protein L37AE/L43A